MHTLNIYVYIIQTDIKYIHKHVNIICTHIKHTHTLCVYIYIYIYIYTHTY